MKEGKKRVKRGSKKVIDKEKRPRERVSVGSENESIIMELEQGHEQARVKIR